MIQCVFSSDPFACGWGLLPAWAQWGLLACLALFIVGVVWRVFSIVKTLGGWPSAIGAVGAIGILLAVFWPRRANQVAQQQAPIPTPRPRPTSPTRKRRKTISDWFK